MSGPLYLDSSTLVKPVLPETGALVELLSGWPGRISGALARVEILRAARGLDKAVARIGLVRIDGEVPNTAARLEPSEPRPLDAVHLATTLSVGDDLDCMVSYGARLSQAAGRNGIPTLSPGAEDGP